MSSPFPKLAMRLFANPQTAHLGFSNCVGPVELTDKDAVHRDIGRFKTALGDADPSSAFMGTISPGQIAFNYPDQHYGSHEKYLAACAEALAYEYRAIIDAGFNLQIDSPDMAMAAHARSAGSSVGDWHHHLPLAVEALNGALEGIPSERVRFHVCWGNTGTPHHLDIPLAEIIDHVLNVNAGTIYVEGANPRHAHEWRVFRDVELPDDKSVILGVIDVKTNYVEHPRLVADRLVQVGQYVGKERLLAGTDCGFDTFIRWSLVDPDVTWLKLGSLSKAPRSPRRSCRRLAPALVEAGYCRRGPGGRRQDLQPRGPPALSREGAGVPRRVRADALRGAVPPRAALVRPGGRAEPDRRRRRSGVGQRCRARSDRRSELPDRARSVQRRDQRARRGCSRARCSPSSSGTRAPASTTPRSRPDGRRAHDDHRDPAHDRPPSTCAPRCSAPTRATRCSTSRSSRLAARIWRSRSPASSGCRRTPTRSRPRPRARACSSISRSSPRRSRATGTRPRRSPASRWRWRRTRRSSAARSCGARRGSRCSSRPPTPDRRSSRSRACARGCGSASGWITSIFDLFEENVRYFPSLLPVCDDEDPLETLERGDVPRLGELRLHNGTIYRWNRPIYDVVRDQPHLRVENRVLPAGPTVVDILANAAFYYGLLRVARRRGAPGVVADVVLGRGGELPRRRARGHRRAPVLARAGRGAGRRAGGPAPAAAGARGPRRAGESPPRTPTACSGSSSVAA